MSNYISTITRSIPTWQPPITTSQVEEFCGFLAMILDSANMGYPLIGIVHSVRAGIGKSTAILAAAETALPPSHTGNPSTLLLELEPSITQMAFVELILKVLGERPRGRTKSHLQQRAIEALQGNDIRLIVFDEADQFSRKTFDILRYICGQSKCPALLVGLKSIKEIVKPYDQLDSRSFLTHEFKPIAKEEVLNVFLPGLVFPLWSFDPVNEHHHSLGNKIVEKAYPSLRLIRGVVQTASTIATLSDATEVTEEHINEAIKHIRFSGLNITPTGNTSADQGEHEARSEERNESKRKGKQNE
jgi:hypothetical protein